jgi:hypothetical protein
MGQRAKWASRESASDAPVCRLPGCRAAATATLRTHPGQARAWLVDGAVAGGDALCTRHADALQAPADWALHDERAQRSPLRRSVEVARRARPVGRPRNLPRLDLRRLEDAGSVDDLLDAHSPLLSRAFAKSRD